jgi:ATP-dependent helicase/nuclease subunit A
MQQPNDSQWPPIRNTTDHLLVAAGAGTGKTFTVVSRILFLLGVEIRGERIATPLRLRDIAAITYTNQAAADLKRKLRRGLRDAGRRAEAQEVDLARIGTIHAFCGEILREFALRSGAPLGGRVLDDAEGGALLSEAVRETLVAAAAEGGVEGMDALLGDYPLAKVGGWVADLAGDGDRLARYRDAREGVGPREQALLELAHRARERMAARLRSEAAVDFDTMIVGTRDLLRDHPEVRRALQRRIRVLIVDEFQDVDPVQREIAYLLGEPASRRADTPRVMFVGDPKQSIYRFRRADVTVWSAVERDFSERGLGLVMPLEESFRSVAPVLAWVEARIGPVLDRPIDGERLQPFEVPFLPVRATRKDGPADRAVEYLLVPLNEEGKPRGIDEARRIEAEAVAERMLELRREMEATLPADAPASERRLWGQMAILLSSWADLAIYQDALERRGIPTYPLRRSGFHDRREVVDLILALQVIRDPRDERALLGFFRSPFVGLRDDTLLTITRQTGRSAWTRLEEVEVADPVEQAELRRGMELLRRYAALRDRVPTAELLGDLLRESGYLAHLALLREDGLQPLANVRKFLGFVEAHAESSVGELLAQIAASRDREDRVEDARLYGEQDDVVTITSVHSAKGLEWRVVFWCDLCRGKQAGKDRLLLGRDRLVLGDPDLKPDQQAEDWQAVREELEREEEAERKRLWYVAATRAKDRLVLSGVRVGKADAGSPAGALAAGLPVPEPGTTGTLEYAGRDRRSFSAVVRLANPNLLPPLAADEEERPVADASSLAPPLPRVPLAAGRTRHSATELLTFSRCQRKHWYRYVAGVREPAPSGRGGSIAAGMSAVVRGQVVHDVLEHLRALEELEGLLGDAIERWDDAWASRPDAERERLREGLREEIRRVAEDPEFRRMAEHASARRELGFLYIASEEHHAVGSIDLAALEGAGVAMLDLKTSDVPAVDAPAVAGAYGPQRDVYVAAASAIGGLPVTRFGFHFSRPGVQVSEELGAGSAAEAADRFLSTARTIGVGVPGLAEDPAHCVRCGYRAAGWCPGVRRPDGRDIAPSRDP